MDNVIACCSGWSYSSNPNPAQTVTDSQFEKILIELNLHIIIALPTHQWVTHIPRPWTLSLPQRGSEALREDTQRGSSATDLTVGQIFLKLPHAVANNPYLPVPCSFIIHWVLCVLNDPARA